MALALGWQDWLTLFVHFLSLSLLAVGGALMLAPDMHRTLVEQQHWLTDPQFAASIALAQAAPGPNMLFIPLLGWYVGLNSGSHLAAAWGCALALIGILLPSTLLTYHASRWAHRRRSWLPVRAFKQAMAPIVIALLLATAWLLAAGAAGRPHAWVSWLLTAACALLVWRTRLHMLWMLAAGAVLGAIGWV